MSAPENAVTVSQALAAGVKTQMYKCLLNQYAQKLWKQLPTYQTQNEGSGHEPQFRSTVWFDGVSYTSPNTFPQRKMAEMDASKIAFFATLQKLRDEASHLVCEDKSFCKSILVEYAARMNISKPVYQTVQLDTPVPVFSSSLVFDNVFYPGDSGRSKKEAEQLAARAVILKYLDFESGNIMSEIVKCKFRNYAEMKETRNGINAVAVQTGSNNNIALNEPKVDVSVAITQTHIPEISTQAIAPATPVPTLLAQTPFSVTNNAPTSSVISAPYLTQFAGIPATQLSSNVIQPGNSDAPSVTVTPLPLPSLNLTQPAFVTITNSKKRNRKNKKNAQKKMRVETRLPIPAVPLSQVPTFSAQ